LAVVRRSALSDLPNIIHLLEVPFRARFANILLRPVLINSRYEVLRFAILGLLFEAGSVFPSTRSYYSTSDRM
jgi:hypothetical protein